MKKRRDSQSKDVQVVVGANLQPGQGTITARSAAGLRDTRLPVSPRKTPLKLALQNLAKAINLALQSDFIETELEQVYKVARVRNGRVLIQHKDYMGLGDGVLAKIGKTAKSFQLTLKGPDPASPEGDATMAQHGRRPLRGILDLVGRKLNLIQEFEDKVPGYVEQMLDRLEAVNMIEGWDRQEWDIVTTDIGLDVILTPLVEEPTAAEGANS